MGGEEAGKKDRNNRNVRKVRRMLLNVVGDKVEGDKFEVGLTADSF